MAWSQVLSLRQGLSVVTLRWREIMSRLWSEHSHFRVKTAALSAANFPLKAACFVSCLMADWRKTPQEAFSPMPRYWLWSWHAPFVWVNKQSCALKWPFPTWVLQFAILTVLRSGTHRTFHRTSAFLAITAAWNSRHFHIRAQPWKVLKPYTEHAWHWNRCGNPSQKYPSVVEEEQFPVVKWLNTCENAGGFSRSNCGQEFTMARLPCGKGELLVFHFRVVIAVWHLFCWSHSRVSAMYLPERNLQQLQVKK